MERVVILVDMDCFYVQVEQRINPRIKGKPSAVVQYNSWKGGGIIAVSYEARKFGVTRQMRGDEAKQKCPEIQLVKVPENRGKADLTRYREAGAEVITVLCKYSKNVERASIDEAYVDVTAEVQGRLARMGRGQCLDPGQLQQTFVAGHDTGEDGQDIEDVRKNGLDSWLKANDPENRQLAIGGMIAEEMRAAVYKETGFQCSAGISHNKMLAKIACGFHKPNRQTILPPDGLDAVFKTVPIRKYRNLGGKLGHSITEDLGVEYMNDLVKYTEKQLHDRYGEKTGSWLHGICRGIDKEPVRPRQLPKSTGCSKNFQGKNALDTKEKLKFWLRSLSKEMEHRLQREEELNNRTAKQLTVYVRQAGSPATSASRSCSIHHVSSEAIARDCYAVIQNLNLAGNQQAAWSPAILCLGISASKFVDLQSSKSTSINTFFTVARQLQNGAALNGEDQSGLARPGEEKSLQRQAAKRHSIEKFLTQASEEEAGTRQLQSRGATVGATQRNKHGTPKGTGIRAFLSPTGSGAARASAIASPSSHLHGTSVNGEKNVDDRICDASAGSGLREGFNQLFNGNSQSPGGPKVSGKGQSFFATKLRMMKVRDAGECSTSIENSQHPDTRNPVILDKHDKENHVESRPANSISQGELDPLRLRQEHSERQEPLKMSGDEDCADVGQNPSRRGQDDLESGWQTSTNLQSQAVNSLRVDEDSLSALKVHQEEHHSPSQRISETAAGRIRQVQLTEDEILCEKCRQIIRVWEYPEHVDYHVALDLQERDRTEVRTVPAVATIPGPSTKEANAGRESAVKIVKKRGRPPGSRNKCKRPKPSEEVGSQSSSGSTLHTFFKSK